MTRRSATTITVQLTLHVPAGSNVKQVLSYITSALRLHKTRGELQDPISALDLDSITLRIVERKTVYL